MKHVYIYHNSFLNMHAQYTLIYMYIHVSVFWMVSVCVCVFADEPVACFLCLIVHSLVVVGFDLMSAYVHIQCTCTYITQCTCTCMCPINNLMLWILFCLFQLHAWETCTCTYVVILHVFPLLDLTLINLMTDQDDSVYAYTYSVFTCLFNCQNYIK